MIKAYIIWIISLIGYVYLLILLGWQGLVGIIIGMVLMFFIIYTENIFFFMLLNPKQKQKIKGINRTWLKK